MELEPAGNQNSNFRNENRMETLEKCVRDFRCRYLELFTGKVEWCKRY